MSKRALGALVLVALLLVLALCGCGEKTSAEVTATALAEVTSDEPVEHVEQGSEQLGEWAEGSGLAMVARAIEDPAAPDTASYEPKPGTRLVAVLFELGSLSGTHHGTPHAAKLIDQRGVKYEAVYGAMADHSEIESVAVSMGERVKGWIAYEVPDGAVPTFLEYKPSVWGRHIELRVSLTEQDG
jgi:hypothetical protein